MTVVGVHDAVQAADDKSSAMLAGCKWTVLAAAALRRQVRLPGISETVEGYRKLPEMKEK